MRYPDTTNFGLTRTISGKRYEYYQEERTRDRAKVWADDARKQGYLSVRIIKGTYDNSFCVYVWKEGAA
jgi:hypothetical protein